MYRYLLPKLWAIFASKTSKTDSIMMLKWQPFAGYKNGNQVVFVGIMIVKTATKIELLDPLLLYTDSAVNTKCDSNVPVKLQGTYDYRLSC